MLDDRRVKVCEIAEAVGISEEKAQKILHKELGMQKLCTWWVPHLLNADQQQTHKLHSQQCLDQFKRDLTDLVWRFVTMDETWVHHYMPETKQQSKQWFIPKESKVDCICWKGHGQCVLGCQRDPINW